MFLIMFRAFFVLFGHPISHSKYATFFFFKSFFNQHISSLFTRLEKVFSND